MAGAFWCIVEDDRQGNPKKVTAEVLGEAARLAAAAGGEVEAVWLTDTASEAGLRALGEWGATKVWLVENAALAPYRGEVWTPVQAQALAARGRLNRRPSEHGAIAWRCISCTSAASAAAA